MRTEISILTQRRQRFGDCRRRLHNLEIRISINAELRGGMDVYRGKNRDWTVDAFVDGVRTEYELPTEHTKRVLRDDSEPHV